jgi:hypothetical protein
MKTRYIQRSFSSGEISPKMLMRGDTDVYQNGVLSMVNFMPTPQGSALRVPGTRFIQEVVGENTARIIPYLTPANSRAVLLFTPESVTIYDNLIDTLEEGNSTPSGTSGSVTYRTPLFINSDFQQGLSNWRFFPPPYSGDELRQFFGVYYDSFRKAVVMAPSKTEGGLYNEPFTSIWRGTPAGSYEATDVFTLSYRLRYVANDSGADRGYRVTVQVFQESDQVNPIYEDIITQDSGFRPGSVIANTVNFDAPSAGFTSGVIINLEVEAIGTTAEPDANSSPRFWVERLQVFGNGERVITTTPLVTPYLEEDLQDIHYVQSPYGDKEIVFTHPKYAPHRLYLDTSGTPAYVFEPITFTFEPGAWAANNYPATCTSYQGRLVLAGGFPINILTGPDAVTTETVWATEVGLWNVFTDPAATEVNPDDSIEFSAIFRSPIQWVYGQRQLLIGSTEYEYAAAAETIFQPADIGVFLQSTHGSVNVQPEAFGDVVLFPADNGTKLRSLRYSNEEDGWTSIDLTIYNPEICFPGIVRIARCRNPQQMCMVLTRTGQVSIFHSESGIEGWSRYELADGRAIDMCVQADNRGVDVPLFLVKRNVGSGGIGTGEEKLYLEAIANFQLTNEWDYNASCKRYAFDTPTSSITGLEHLNGARVQVSDRENYYGSFPVSDGSLTISDGDGNVIAVTEAVVGLQHRSSMQIPPPEVSDPGSAKRYSEIGIRTIGSSRPFINDQRPKDRDPQRALGLSQNLDDIRDLEVRNLGWDPYQLIEVSEFLPYNLEVLGVYGDIKVGTI